MAFTNFYLIAGGAGSADINAGSSIGAAQATTTNGNWNAATGVFIAASGTPFASTIVGDYASVYVDGATVTLFVGRVTAVTSSTQITVDVTTIKYGAAIPTTSATARSCTINGSWNTEQVLAAGGLATFTVPQSTKINIKGNLTLTANRTISMAGATTTPLWFSGYNTTPGDLDNDTTNSLAKPIWTFNATFGLSSTGTHQLYTSLSVAGNRSNFIWQINATAPVRLLRCRIENVSSNASAHTFTPNGSAHSIQYCWFKAPTTGTSNGVVDTLGASYVYGCIAEGGGLAGFSGTSNGVVYTNCVCLNNTGVGILATTGAFKASGCTIYNSTSDGIKWSGTPTTGGAHITDCLFNICGGYGINNASGTNTNNVFRYGNKFFTITSGNENGFGDSPAFLEVSSASSLVRSSTDMTPIGNALDLLGNIFENQSYKTYAPAGAIVPASSGGSAVAIFNN